MSGSGQGHDGADSPSDSELDELFRLQARLTLENAELRLRLRKYEASRMVALAVEASNLARPLLPVGSKRRRLAGIVARSLLRQPTPLLRTHAAYRDWLERRRPRPEDLDLQAKRSAAWTYRPLISICLPVYDPDPKHLSEAIASVRAQSYDHWELCVCDDASPRPEIGEVLQAAAREEPRIKLVRAEHNGGISRATNAALGLATGEFVGFLDDDDLLEPHTLFLYGQVLQDDPAVDLIYCDEDMLLPSGERAFPLLKPGWSPETLLGMNYVTHFVVARRALVEEVGGLRPERDGAQDHDLLLRLGERTSAVRHIAEVLYSWRQSRTSTALTAKAKPWAYRAGSEAVADALERRGTPGCVEAGGFPGAYRVRYEIPAQEPEVVIVIPTRDRGDLLGPCLESIRAKTRYRNYSIVVLDNDSREPATAELLRRSEATVVPAPGPFNYASIMNRGFAAVTAELVLTLNNDTRIIDSEWLGGLVELMGAPNVGVVGCRLVFGDGRLQHEGIALGCGVPAANLSFESPGMRVLGGTIRTTRDVSAVTGACSLIRRSAWERVGGYDEAFAVAYNDVDFCLRLGKAGYRVLFTPYVTVVHDESSSRGDLHPVEDEALLLRRWAPEISAGDPFFSPRLTIGPYGLELDVEERMFRGKELAELALRYGRPSG